MAPIMHFLALFEGMWILKDEENTHRCQGGVNCRLPKGGKIDLEEIVRYHTAT